jgi:2-polyprenyl-6-methoxyphenol hydroxylase-like FAD-dependent oxidoreductase
MPIFRPQIAIIGGGPSGLALSRLLHQRNIYPTIYELRSKPTAEDLLSPSGMLDLHIESGQSAIHECGLWAPFLAAVGDCSEAQRVMNPAGTVLHTDEGELSSRPEIARNALTSLLLQNLPSDSIKWNQRIAHVDRSLDQITGATRMTLSLPHGKSTYDLVIGADGAWSRIRPFLTPVQPHYTGVQFLTFTIRNVSANFPQLLTLTGTGAMSALGGGNGLMTHRGPMDSIRLYAAISTPHEDWTETAGLTGKTAADVASTLLGDDRLFGKWAAELRELLATACKQEALDHPGDVADIKPSYMLPVGNSWDHHTGATLIGDAAHLMTPWAGEGVNLALWDALDLSRVLAGVPDGADVAAWQEALAPSMRAFEEGMSERAREKAEETVRNMDMFLSEDGGEKMAAFFKVAGL